MKDEEEEKNLYSFFPSFRSFWKLVVMSAATHHYLNPLHIYWGLRALVVGKRRTMRLRRLYERIIFNRYLLLLQVYITHRS